MKSWHADSPLGPQKFGTLSIGACSPTGSLCSSQRLGFSARSAGRCGRCWLAFRSRSLSWPWRSRLPSFVASAAASENSTSVPNYTAWRHLDAFELQDATKLWTEIDPNDASSGDSIAWAEVFKSKIVSGGFEIISRNLRSRIFARCLIFQPPSLRFLPDPLQGVVFSLKSKDRIRSSTTPENADRIALANNVLADDQVRWCETRQGQSKNPASAVRILASSSLPRRILPWPSTSKWL